MEQIWIRIERWLGENAPAALAGLNPPATPSEVEETERYLGVQLPESVRQSYLRHNGQTSDSPAILIGWEWLSLARIRGEWKVWKDLLDGGDFDGIENDEDGTAIRRDWWHPAWIPISYSGSGDHHCLDLAPGPEGTSGQIIEMWHDQPSRPLLAESFEAFLADFAEGLERGDYVFSEDWFAIVRSEDA